MEKLHFFNDAAFGVAPNLSALRQRANSISDSIIEKCESTSRRFRAIDLRESGYARVDWGDAALIADMARIGPDYLPGHAHADSLSFEFSLNGSRLFVNSGTSCYGISPERQRQRGTSAHNTVEIDGKNSSEIWSGFRVARRAYPHGRSVTETEGMITLACAHDGYMRFPGKVTHFRKWICTPRALVIEDALSGDFSIALSRLILHPDWEAAVIDGQEIRLSHRTAEHQVYMAIEGGFVRIESFTWHPRFGEVVATKCLVVDFESSHLRCKIIW
jgi:uncharacterized heparinase superfamily protein